MKASKQLYKIPIDFDIAPAITETAKTVGALFELIEKSLPSEQERLIRLGLKQAAILAKVKKRATKHEIAAYMKRIKAKRRALRIAKKEKLPLDGIKNDLLILLNELAD